MDENPSSTAVGELVTHKYFRFGAPKMTTGNGAGFPVTIVTPSFHEVPTVLSNTSSDCQGL